MFIIRLLPFFGIEKKGRAEQPFRSAFFHREDRTAGGFPDAGKAAVSAGRSPVFVAGAGEKYYNLFHENNKKQE